MRISGVPAVVAFLLLTASGAPTVQQWGWPWGLQDSNSTQTDFLAYNGLANLLVYTLENGFPKTSNCSLENLAVRTEW